MAVLLATITLTLAAPREEVPAIPLYYNLTEIVTFTSEPIPEEGYFYNIKPKSHPEDDEKRVAFNRLTRNEVITGRYSVTRTYFQFPNKANITTLEITNVKAENDGGRVSIVAGGVGKDFVTLHFLSELNNGLEYEIEIWCK